MQVLYISIHVPFKPSYQDDALIHLTKLINLYQIMLYGNQQFNINIPCHTFYYQITFIIISHYLYRHRNSISKL